jgi:hypothetical protein
MLYSDLPGTYYGVCTICWLYDTSSCHCEDPFLFLEINVYEMFCIKEKKRVFTILKSISCISTSTGTLSLFFFTPCLTSSSYFPSLSLSLSLYLSLATKIGTNPFVNKIFPTETKVEQVWDNHEDVRCNKFEYTSHIK